MTSLATPATVPLRCRLRKINIRAADSGIVGPMSFGRPFGRVLRRWLTGWTVFALLFMQLATAAHACGRLAAPDAQRTVTQAQATPCAEMMQDSSSSTPVDQPPLCLKHCQPDPQGVDAGHAPALSAPAVVSVLPLVLPDEAMGDMPMPPGAQAEQRATPPPPIGILHCCWRI